jgi:hypothetical protein
VSDTHTHTHTHTVYAAQTVGCCGPWEGSSRGEMKTMVELVGWHCGSQESCRGTQSVDWQQLRSAAESITSVLAIGGSVRLLVLRLIFLTPCIGRQCTVLAFCVPASQERPNGDQCCYSPRWLARRRSLERMFAVALKRVCFAGSRSRTALWEVPTLSTLILNSHRFISKTKGWD